MQYRIYEKDLDTLVSTNVRILHNRVKCNVCGEEIESFTEDDSPECSCKHVKIEGGHAYIARMYNSGSDFTELSSIELVTTDPRDGPDFSTSSDEEIFGLLGMT